MGCQAHEANPAPCYLCINRGRFFSYKELIHDYKNGVEGVVLYYLLTNAGLLAVVLWATCDVKRFLSAHAKIDATALDAFKDLARRNMLTTLVVLPVAVVSFLWSIYLCTHIYRSGLIIVVATQIPILFFSQKLKKIENISRDLDAADEIKEEYQSVGQIWVKKAFPKF